MYFVFLLFYVFLFWYSFISSIDLNFHQDCLICWLFIDTNVQFIVMNQLKIYFIFISKENVQWEQPKIGQLNLNFKMKEKGNTSWNIAPSLMDIKSSLGDSSGFDAHFPLEFSEKQNFASGNFEELPMPNSNNTLNSLFPSDTVVAFPFWTIAPSQLEMKIYKEKWFIVSDKTFC